ncbi:MAG: hypothetical protein WCF81_02235 [Roseiarcus sp.]
MSRAPLVLSAAALACASSFLALADERSAISSAVQRSEVAAKQKSAARHQEQEYRVYRHYRGYDEAPSAMIVSSQPA